MSKKKRTGRQREPRDNRALKLVEALITEGKVTLYLDVLLEPHIHVDDDRHEKDWPLEDGRAFEWLGEIFWAKYVELLHLREFKRILPVLRGKARKQEKRDAPEKGLLTILEKIPVLGLVAEFTESKGLYTKSYKTFFDDLDRFRQKRDSWKHGRKRFPGGSNVLSHILNVYTDTLRQLRVDYSNAPTATNSRVVTLKWLPGDRANQSPAQSPDVNPVETSDLQPEGDPEVAERNRRRERLERLRHQPPAP